MKSDPSQVTRQWIDTIVVGLNLCPFAASVLRDNTVQMTVCNETADSELLKAVLRQLDNLHCTDETVLSTSFLIFSHTLLCFDRFLVLAETANELLFEVGLQSDIQIATFHPDYCFHGVDSNDVSHFSNRSPYPMLHFLRESQVTKALEKYPNPEQIPDNNIKRLRQLGREAIVKLLDK